MRYWRYAAIFAFGLGISTDASAGGAWVPDPGDGWIQLGFSRKTAHTSWDVNGDLFTNTRNVDGVPQIFYHDFRYGYLTGEVGVVRNLSANFVLTYLDGIEGATAEPYKNRGLSDAWFGAKYQFRRGELPMAFALDFRTGVFYDLPGPYNRFLFNADGSIRGNSPEWRGLLKSDLTAWYHISHSFAGGQAWGSFAIGYTWRGGAPADQIPAAIEAGYRLPWLGAAVKATGLYVRSRYNESVPQPDDRFGSGQTFNFNEASLGRIGAGFMIPFGRNSRWGLEAGYNAWIWGRSARRYREPYVSIFRSF